MTDEREKEPRLTFDGAAQTIGVPEDRLANQFTAQILYHPPGEPGHVYAAQVLAHVRANSLAELAQAIEDFDAPFVRDPESWQAVADAGRRAK